MRVERGSLGLVAAMTGLLGCGEGADLREPVGQGGLGGAAGSGAVFGGGSGSMGTPPGGLPGDALFAAGNVLDVRLSLDPAALNELEEHGNREEYVPSAALLESAASGGATFGEIGVRYKGSYSLHHCWDEVSGVRSRELECAKLSIKLKLDEYDRASRFDGLKRLDLHASSGDASKLHELVGYQTFRDFGVDAPRAVPARVYINDELRGLFIAVEDVDGRYTAAHFPDGPNGNLYKEVWPSAGATDQDFLAALQTNEELADVTDMRAFADAVRATSANSVASDLAPFVEIEPLLRYIAVDRGLRNWDGIMAFYSPSSPHNFYWYQDDGPARRFHLIPWDLDGTFWPFDPYAHPRDWVTAPPIPDFNSTPLHCEPRAIWEANGSERVTPPRCDRLLDALVEGQWAPLTELGRALAAGPLAPARLSALTDAWVAQLEPLVAQDPTIDAQEFQRGVLEFREVIARASRDLEALLAEGLIEERAPSVVDTPPPEALAALTEDGGLHVGGITNFEFAAPPLTPEPAGAYAYADPLATFAATWNTDAPISGSADLRLDFTFNRGPLPYDEWTGIGLGCAETDVRAYSKIVVSLSSDVERSVRVRISSSAYDELFGGVGAEFGRDYRVGPDPRAIVVDFAEVFYPSWAKDGWSAEQGFPGTDAEALALVLQHFDGLIFGPTATLDAAGELSAATETGYLRIDNIYFR